MTRAQTLALLLLAACSDATAPPLNVAALSGTYQAALTSNGPNSCNALEMSVLPDTVTWRPTCSTPPGFLSRTAGGIRDATGQEVRLYSWATLAGGDSAATEEYTFTNWVGSADGPHSKWLGPCTIPLDGSGLGCRRESGSAVWRR